jgi:DNA-binding beta-propeller fold protein YncE
MSVLGAGEYTYRLVEDWAKWPEDWSLHDVAAVSVDAKDQVYAFHRGEHPMVVFDRDGNVLRTWGEGVFTRPHGVHLAPDETLYLTDEGDHSVRRCTLDGKILVTIGVPGEPAPFMSGKPFRRCTHTALSPKGEIYVSDGYGNARVHKYAPDGKHLFSWGEPGCGEGQFNLPHAIACDADGWVYVADRENHRIQVFAGDGRFETQWHGLHRPSGMYMPPGKCSVCYVGEIAPAYRGTPNLGPRVTILDNEGKLIARITADPCHGDGPGQFYSPHGLAVDSRGDLYVGEVSYTAWKNIFPDTPRPPRLRALQKFARVRTG